MTFTIIQALKAACTATLAGSRDSTKVISGHAAPRPDTLGNGSSPANRRSFSLSLSHVMR
ncbi:hypothetical protein [Novosphingobium terrae]|uniref:hypothetical protein n=1 Tax=Novosphingobium terrae TaxID=2726189 RepID=UPI001980A45F|nr:hypothetical protein [Novosphingobium terrae]